MNESERPYEILIACEWSGIVRDTFIERGAYAYSCDIIPCERHGPHIQCNVLDILDKGWDMMIAFPPCTHLAGSGARHFKYKQVEQREALSFIRRLMEAPIPKIAIENPVGIISTKIRKPDQIIQPYDFGHDVSKKTCLWLKNLPLLRPTKHIAPEYHVNGLPRWANQSPCGADRSPPSSVRGKMRGKSYQGIADAMADQWYISDTDGARTHE